MGVSRIILLVVALVAGGLAAFLATRGSAPQVVVEGPTKVIEEKKTKILVAKGPIGVGQRLTKDTIEWQDWPELAIRAEYVSETELPDALTEMNGAVARFEIFPGEPIAEQKLVRSDQGYLSAVLTKGMRGVSVPVKADAAAGGFVVPNDRVDVVLTRSGVTQTILANVKVLAIGTRLGQVDPSPKDDDAKGVKAGVFTGGTIATLELTPAQGELIINAAKVGTLSVVLRSIADFAQPPGVAQQNEASRAIRMIRFGQDRSVMPADNGAAVGVSEASFEESSDEEFVPEEEPMPADETGSEEQSE